MTASEVGLFKLGVSIFSDFITVSISSTCGWFGLFTLTALYHAKQSQHAHISTSSRSFYELLMRGTWCENMGIGLVE